VKRNQYSRGAIMRIVLRLLVCIICVAPCLAAQPWQVDSTKIGGAVQDSTGRIWGFGAHPNLGVYRWEGEKWLSLSVAGVPDKAWPWVVTLGSDGAVYFLWSDGSENIAVSRHQETAGKLLVRFAGHLRDRPRIFVDPGGNIWITEQGRRIFRVTSQGKAECVYTITDDQFLEHGRPKSENWAFNPICATADGRGRVWFWSNSLAGRTDWASLQGVLVFDGVKFEHHAQLAGVPDKKLSVIEADGAEHMWLAVVDDQLYRADINKLTGMPAAQSASSAFRYVQKIFRTGQETYVISGPVFPPVPERNGGGRFGVLWRLLNGEWTRVVNGLDMRPESFQQPFRPYLATDGNLWLGTFGCGPWVIPKGDRNPTLVDWHYNYPLDGSEGLFQLENGRMLILSANQGSLAVKQAELLSVFQSPPEVSTLNPLRTLAQDAQSHIWGILATGDNALSEWDGQSWAEHPIPQSFPAQQSWDATLDSLGRIWLPFRSAGGVGDLSPVIAWSNPDVFAAGTTTEGVNIFGTGFGTSGVVTYTRPGVSCIQTYASDTQITCTVSIIPDFDAGSFDYKVTSKGYNAIPFDDGLSGNGVGIFDPKHRSFETFPTYDQALEAQLPLRKDFHLSAKFFKSPSFAPEGRISYRETRTRLRYYDGERWREWSTKDISGPEQLEFEEPPFFDHAGKLAVHLQGKTWEFSNQKGWQTIAPEPSPYANQALNPPRFTPIPPGCAAGHLESLVQDRLGTFWFTSQGQLYRAIAGQCAPQFAPDEHQPFVDSRKLQDVLTDPQGNAFLLTQVALNYSEYVVLKAQPPLPRTVLRAFVGASGGVTLRFATKSKGASGFTWRMDGGPWSTPTKSAEITLEELSNGTHRIEAAAVDQRLQFDLAPAAAVVDIHIDIEAHVRELIQKLADPDYSVREKAVAALVGRGTLALPLLQLAREKANPDQRWWIDAAMQQIEENLAVKKTP
jgi:streptogramin lyase